MTVAVEHFFSFFQSSCESGETRTTTKSASRFGGREKPESHSGVSRGWGEGGAKLSEEKKIFFLKIIGKI